MFKKISGFSRTMLTILTVIVAVLLITTILDQIGYKLILREFNFLGCILLLLVLMIWGAVLLTRKVKQQYRTVFALLMVFVLMLIGLLGLNYALDWCSIAYPHEYMTVDVPGGGKVVVLRTVDIGGPDEEDSRATIARMDVRKAYLEGEDSQSAEYPYGAYGYVYSAYPRVLGILVNTRAQSEGAVYMGADTKATLDFDWSEPGMLRISVRDPQPGDEGEVLLKLS